MDTATSVSRPYTPTFTGSIDKSAIPSFEDVRDILDGARLDADDRYSGIPVLFEELRTQYLAGVDACEQQQRNPLDILSTRLRQERLVFDAYNKHRLGHAPWRFYSSMPTPENIDEHLSLLGDDIKEDLESFPLRCETVTSGFAWLTEDLEPIYQSAENVAIQPTQMHQPVTPTTAKTPASTKPKTGRATENYDKLADAPPCNLDFPDANMTLMELATFLPGSFKSWDVIDRACGNGASAASITTLINAGRTMARGEIPNNSVYRLMKGPMDRRAKQDDAWKGWTVGTHDRYPQPANFNPSSVSVAGFRTAADGRDDSSADPVLFRDLARGVKKFPTGYDALDLTRAVRYCVDHPDEAWYYPTDYERLVDQLPQDAHLAGYPTGPAPVQVGHQDKAVMKRWVTGRTLTGVRNASGRKYDSRGRLMKKDSDEDDFDENEFDSDENELGSGDDIDFEALDKKASKRKHFFDDSDSDEFDTPSRKPVKPNKFASKPRVRKSLGKSPARPSHLRKELFTDDLDFDDSDNSISLEKNTKKTFPTVRRSGRSTKVAGTYNVDEALAAISGEDDEEMDALKAKKANMLAKYGMDTEMGDNDDEEFEDDE
ncbi:hypothetical protein FB567DRAFT_528882 [Paraphoma chrysanthemicola]|uniref:Uncharacterized protein n=1 Tax=Paraphoma chrysanthemicola TaxID=798071 RepID=A0A8K0R1X6_9PLEO|nr:hypothetical protein FB567DRAFT_528882 [Paraphoma chrysanthemicola]